MKIGSFEVKEISLDIFRVSNMVAKYSVDLCAGDLETALETCFISSSREEFVKHRCSMCKEEYSLPVGNSRCINCGYVGKKYEEKDV